MPHPDTWHNMEVKSILKQLENIKHSGNQVSSSTNHILQHHPDYKYISLRAIYLQSSWGFLHYNLIWKVLFWFIHKMSGYPTESYWTAEIYSKHDFSEGYTV